MKKLEKYSIINLLIYTIGIILWNFFYSPFNLIVIIITYGLLIVSFVLGVFYIIRLLNREIKAIIFLIIALIPILDFLSDYHNKAFDFFKPEKELVAIRNLGNCTNCITLWIDNQFEFREQSTYGARIYKGSFTRTSDTLIFTFNNKIPNGIKDSKLFGYIQVNELILKVSNDSLIDFPIRYNKEKTAVHNKGSNSIGG